MSKILVLKSSIMGSASQTNSLIDAFLSERRQKARHDEVIEHDLTTLELPILDSELFNALRNGQNLSSRARQVVTLSDRLIAELKKSEIVVIGAPMYNLNVPTQLKNWFDLVARAGVTFKYTETYPQGLIDGVKAVVMSSRGGVHVGQATDAVTPYLRSVLSLIGISDVEFIYAEGMDIKPYGRDKAIADARARIAALA